MQIFADALDKSNLLQGDLLVRNAPLTEALQKAHGYYATATDYTHFLILTQSCDLIRRPPKGCKSRYITLAAARPLQLVIDRFLEGATLDRERLPARICDKSYEDSARQLIERILNHEEEGIFYIPRSASQTVSRDLCIFLTLSVAIRVDHYEACLASKVSQLDDVFAAKVGWLTGSLYSKVATPELANILPDHKRYLRDIYEQTLYREIVWLRKAQYESMKPKLEEWRGANPEVMSGDTLNALVKNIPREAQQVADCVTSALLKKNLITPESADKVRNIISNDGNLKKVLASLADD
ncbi:MAG: hypothetical protein JNM20_07590 [Rhizobiales bacterium]|nr:hypothetical protein [Hyphomicrobiales bacterium]